MDFSGNFLEIFGLRLYVHKEISELGIIPRTKISFEKTAIVIYDKNKQVHKLSMSSGIRLLVRDFEKEAILIRDHYSSVDSFKNQ
jgi:hypothetical protein